MADAAAGMDRTLRWGILGPGRIAPRLVRAIAATPRAELVAVGSRDAGRAAEFADRFGIPTAYGSYEELLRAGLDVVYIALPNHLHAPWTVAALEAGTNVLCEKPLARSVEEVDAIVEASRRSGRIAVEAFMYLHHPQILRALELARGGALGPLELVHGSFSYLLSHPNDPRVEPGMGAGSLWDVGCYPVSFARRLAGEEPDWLDGVAHFDDRFVDRTFVGQMRFPGGLLAQFDSGFAAPDRQRLEIVGRDATLVLDAPFLTTPDGPDPGLALRRNGGTERIDVPVVDQYAEEVADLTAAILDGTAPRIDLAFSRGGIATLGRLDAIARGHAGVPAVG